MQDIMGDMYNNMGLCRTSWEGRYVECHGRYVEHYVRYVELHGRYVEHHGSYVEHHGSGYLCQSAD